MDVNNKYAEQLIQLALDLINSYDPYLKEPETLKKPADLDEFMEKKAGIIVTSPTGEEELKLIKSMRSQLWQAVISGEFEEVIGCLNSLLTDIPVELILKGSTYSSLHLEYKLLQASSSAVYLQFESVLGLALALQEYSKDRIKSCNASPCQEVFIDLSKNRTRRFCSERCANRFNIAAYRERLPSN